MPDLNWSVKYGKIYGPGAISTEFMKSLRITMELPDKNFESRNLTMVGHMGESVDVADSILYVASDHAAFVTRTNLFVDGGSLVISLGVDAVGEHDLGRLPGARFKV
ncbi:unnamed protein product [Oppiella nova]|uniref:Uncharacterized protein n=1 Tax=Oppiella nova TaxID=334625 RepID=A0A7R9LEC7_9ACAR|nr:unnamed protein product [Oppiella nova]CAG2162699.1 unnamed protein product [Oppiella nova]